MITIHKYSLAPQRRNELKLPLGYEFLSAQEQHGKIVVWVKVDSDLPFQYTVAVLTFYTGVELPRWPMKHIDTVQLHNGHTVIHVFEEL